MRNSGCILVCICFDLVRCVFRAFRACGDDDDDDENDDPPKSTVLSGHKNWRAKQISKLRKDLPPPPRII